MHRGRPLNSVVRLHVKRLGLAIAAVVTSLSVVAREAPSQMSRFNQTCPAPRLLPELERSYQACVANRANACERFVVVFKQLLPEYDCQRSFDVTPKGKYIVPAIWLADDRLLGQYLELLAGLETGAARELFASPQFRAVLDGDFAEIYKDKSLAAERQLKGK